jgi:hypothetical protein
MYLGYIDDSGRYDKKKQMFEVLSTVLVPDKMFNQMEVDVGVCVADVIPEDKLERFEEFHAWELYGGYGIFDGIEQEKRFQAIKDLLSIIPRNKLAVVYGAVNLPKLQCHPYGSAAPTDIAFRLCVPAIDNFMSTRQSESTLEYALLIADDTDKEKRSRLKKSFREFRKQIRPPNWEPVNWYLHDDMYFGSSKDSIGIQLADLCAYFIAKHLDEDQSAEGFYEIFKNEIAFSKIEPG